jgi:hypothetical protein
METQRCPICLTEVYKSARYPNYLCVACASRACDAEKRPLVFYNETLTGGFLAFYADTNEKYDSHICYVDGVKCWADEDYYGGIIVRVKNSDG